MRWHLRILRGRSRRNIPVFLPMKRNARPWMPLTCCIATLCHLAVPLSVSTILSPRQAFADTANGAPTIENPLTVDLPGGGTLQKLEAKIPVGKTLLIPISASDPDDDPLSYTVTSSNPKVMVRARTGRPLLKIKVKYDGVAEDPDDPNDPNDSHHPAYDAFEGDLEFQLFRDWTPVTAGFIGGFAQSVFYSPEGVGTSSERYTIFHRVVKDFMCQGGNPYAQDPDSTVNAPGFSFDNEFATPLLFTGRGQLAMANAGSGTSFEYVSGKRQPTNYEGTNGSQFFVTTSSPRFLDMKHTVFGQLVRGWDILEKMENVPVTTQPGGTEVSRPTEDIKITQTSLEPDFSDAVLVLSATAKTTNPAKITVKVDDGKGGTATREFEVTVVDEEYNTPPFFTQIPEHQVVALNRVTAIPVRAIDLEYDYFSYENRIMPRSFPRGDSSRSGTPMLVLPYASFAGPMTLGFWLNQLEMRQNTFGLDENANPLEATRDRRSILLGVNDRSLRTEPVPVTGKPGVSLNVPVASYIDTDPRGQSSSVSVSINWGDGKDNALGVGAAVKDTSRPMLGAFKISGTHTYAKAGVYPVVTTISNSSTGLKHVVYSTAVITDGDLVVTGQKHSVKGRVFAGQPLAFFKDAAGGTKPSDYEVTLDWGDGTVTPGQIRQTPKGRLTGEFYITGSHKYADPETFSVAIKLRKKGTPDDAYETSWATLEMYGFQPQEQHLPPFPMARLVGIMGQVVDTKKQQYKPLRTTTGAGAQAQTTFAVSLSLLNNGNKTANPSKIQFYLSVDDRLNLNAETKNEGTEAEPKIRTNPKDIPLTIGKSMKELSLIALKPGMGGGLAFDLVGSQDTRLYAPKGEAGTGYNLLAVFAYDDPIVKQLDLDREIAMEIAPVLTAPSLVEVSEYEGPIHTRPLTLTFHRRPTKDVTVKMKMVNGNNAIDTSEAEFKDAPAEHKGEFTVTYTKEMWDAGTKTVDVQITGKADPSGSPSTTDGSAFVVFDPTDSEDGVYHGRTLSFVQVVNRDLQSYIKVEPLTLTTNEKADHTNHTKTFKVTMGVRPGGNVKVPIVVGDPTEGQVSGATVNGQNTLPSESGVPTLTFTKTESYPASRTITVTAIDDNEADGDIPYTITVGPSSSTDDPRFNQLTPPGVSVTNVDNPPANP